MWLSQPLLLAMDFILLFKALLLGLVEGATEFLPVSSTGHLIIVGDLHFNDGRGKVFEIVIQLGPSWRCTFGNTMHASPTSLAT